MVLQTFPGEKQLYCFEARLKGELGQLYLTTKRIVFVPDDWTNDESGSSLSELHSEPRVQNDEIKFKFLDGQVLALQVRDGSRWLALAGCSRRDLRPNDFCTLIPL